MLGEVFNPATFKIESAQTTVKQYIEMAGGFKESADGKNAYVVKANGTVITRKNADILNYARFPGDVIIVPQQLEIKNNFKVFMDSLTSIIQISGLLLSAATIIIALRK